MELLAENCRREGIPLYQIGSRRQGIVHVIGPELGLTQPGMLIVCGDSHTSTHGAFGALAFGIGTSEVELVLATQCLPQRRQGDLAVNVSGDLPLGVTAKDVVLGLIGRTGTSAGQGHLVEYRGPTIRALSMEGRMTVCNSRSSGAPRPAWWLQTTPRSNTWRASRTRRADRCGKRRSTTSAHWRPTKMPPSVASSTSTRASSSRT